MVKKVNLLGAAAAALLACGVSAHAAVIDFTDAAIAPVGSKGPYSGSIGATSWTLTGFPVQVQAPEACTSAVPDLACDNDGIGIAGPEITGNGRAYATVTFSRQVALVGAWFLDLFVAADGSNAEIAYISKDGNSIPGAVAVTADLTFPNDNGFKKADGFKLVGTTFTFFVDPVGNDNVGRPDAALAGLEIAPVPLPAGGLLIASALGGLGLMRRKQKMARSANA